MLDPATTRHDRVAVVGGGWAGCAAAVTLALAGIPVTLFERSRVLGGRARRVGIAGNDVDNGQHLLVGAYRQTLELVSTVHGEERGAAQFHRVPLTVRRFGVRRPDALTLRALRLPAPLHLAGGLATARGLSCRDRSLALAQFRALAQSHFRCAPGQTVAELLARAPRTVVAGLWAPLCLAALNTPPERASAQIFANVLRETFAAPASRSDFLIPATDLSTCFPDAAARVVAAHRGEIRRGAAVRNLMPDDGGVHLDVGETRERFAGAIVAVAPYQLADVAGIASAANPAWRETLERVAAYAYESITTIYLRFATPLPMRAPLLRLDDAPGQWIFRHRPPAREPTRRQHAADANEPLYSVVISACGPHDTMNHASLAAEVVAQLRRLAGDLPSVSWSRVIAERRATYACTPGLARPAAGRIAPGLYLAGDHTDSEFPATLEAATRSGVVAARALIADRSPVTA